MRPPRSSAFSALLAPLASVYGAAVARRNARYDAGAGVSRAPVPVVSVGNVVAGGTGKTPLTAWLVARLAARGAKPAVVTRGYGGGAGRGPLEVGRDGRPLVPAVLAGDEPYLLTLLTGAPVVAGSDRVAGARYAAARGADVVVLDDGFQHRRLARALDVVLVDAASPFGNGRLLPAGPLREPATALHRAGIVVLTRWDQAYGAAGERDLCELGLRAPVVRSVQRPAGFRRLDGVPVAAPARAVAFCGIARPEVFLSDLRGEDVEVVRFEAFPDHHEFRGGELDSLVEAARASGASLVTTMKDLARLSGEPEAAWRGTPPVALHVATEILDPTPVEAALDAALGTHP